MYDCILSICFIKEMMMMMMTVNLRSYGCRQKRNINALTMSLLLTRQNINYLLACMHAKLVFPLPPQLSLIFHHQFTIIFASHSQAPTRRKRRVASAALSGRNGTVPCATFARRRFTNLRSSRRVLGVCLPAGI